MTNREIKFRAWDNGTMVNDLSLTDFGNEQLQDRLHTYPPLELMQFTGIKDKNGKQMFQGDIFGAENGNWEIKMGEWKYYDGKNLVTMHGFYAERKESGTCNQRPLIPEEIEVIGNIYSNPELLK